MEILLSPKATNAKTLSTETLIQCNNLFAKPCYRERLTLFWSSPIIYIFVLDLTLFVYLTQFYERFCVWKTRQKSFGNASFSNLPNKNILVFFCETEKLRKSKQILRQFGSVCLVCLITEFLFFEIKSCAKFFISLNWTDSDSENVAKTTAMILRKVNLKKHEKTREMATPKVRTRPNAGP